MKQEKSTILILGGDGYLGWSLGLAFANRTNYNVVLVDNLIKRKWEKEVGAKILVPLKSPKKRIAEFKKIYGKSNLSFEKVELLDSKAVVALIKKYKPSAILNAAQQPSAPFSMMSAKNAAATFQNNIVGHLNVLWAIAETDKNIKYIKLGSTGSYMGTDTDFVPFEKVDFAFEYKGKSHKVLNSWMPMYATDFYHQSKIFDFLIDELCGEVWNMRVLTVQQSTIFGATIPENEAPENHGLATRFNYDDIFGTVMNRFVCQVAIDHPLTIYGDGTQRTGMISLSDTVANFLDLVEMDIPTGKHTVIHNFSNRPSIREIADALMSVDDTVKVNYICNPRKEPAGALHKEVETHHLVAKRAMNASKYLKEEVRKLLDFTKKYSYNIDRTIITPKVTWEKQEIKQERKKPHGTKKKADRILLRDSGALEPDRVQGRVNVSQNVPEDSIAGNTF